MARPNRNPKASRTRKAVLGDNPFEALAGKQSKPAADDSASKPKPAPKRAKADPAASKPDKPKRPARQKAQANRQADTSDAPKAVTQAPPLEATRADDAAHEPALDLGRTPAAEPIRSAEHPAELNDTAVPPPLPFEQPKRQPDEGGVFDVARELLSSDFYLRQWGRMGMRNRSEVVDDFGHDPKYDARFQPLLDFLYRRYFRATTEGIEHIPSEGPALIVVNHAGTFPYDGVMLKTAIRNAHPNKRELRWLAEDHFFYLPFVGSFMNRMGCVRACPENAERLLAQRRLVAVFPEGVQGTGRLYRERYRLQRFGRGGFIRLCLRTRTPLVPCVIIGAEDAMPLLYRVEYLADVLGMPYIPVTPTFPWLGPLGLIPAPTKWSFIFGDRMDLDGYGPEAADDPVLVNRLAERVRASMQAMIDEAVASRRSVWVGM